MYHFIHLLSILVYSIMSHYGYLPHEYTYALFLADHYDLYPLDSKIHNMVSERYPRDEDDDASASASDYDIDEDEDSDDAAFASMIKGPSASHDHIVFGSFESPIVPVSTPSIEPKFDGFSVKIGEISCAIIDPCCNIIAEDDSVFIDSQEDEKLQVLEPELKIHCSDFIVSEASEEFVIHTASVRLRSTVYGVAAVRTFASWLFVGKQSEQPVSAINNQPLISSYMMNPLLILILVEALRFRCFPFTMFYVTHLFGYGGYHGTEEGKGLISVFPSV